LIPLHFVAALGLAGCATHLPAVLPPAEQVDHIVVSKSHHTLALLAKGQTLHTYAVALGRAAGVKQQQGDHRTPEGHYVIDARNPHSGFHLALHVSYPNSADRAHALTLHQPPGGDVEIHGLAFGFGFLGRLQHIADWTDGCIAVTNSEIEEIYRLVPNGTPVDIAP
jgi:murein L,D-transpeptidase YafK